MKTSIRILSLLLAVLMLVPAFAACGKTGDDQKDGDTTTASSQGDAADTEIVLPEMDWGGQEYRILGRDSTNDFFDNFEVWREERPEDVVGKAVFERNEAINQKYGIVVRGTLDAKNESMAKTMLESGEDLYDLIILSPEEFHPLSLQGYLVDMYTLDYVNTNHDGWQQYANQQMGMGGRLYYTTNKFLLQDKHRSWMIYYNRELARALNLGYFETLVFDGTWTLEKANELMKAAASDSDGTPGMTKRDTWGMATQTTYSFAQLAFGAGFRITESGTDGYPKLIGANDRMIQILDAVYVLTANPDAYYGDYNHGGVVAKDNADQVFYAERALMLEMCVSALDYLGSEIDFEFGILPNPKFDEKQEDYYSIPNLNNGSLFGVPATILDLSFAGFALQAITEESLETSYTQYIETKCKLQDAYDEDAARCLDIIFDGVVYDIAFINNIAGYGALVSQTLGGLKTNTYSRLADRLKKVGEKELDKIRETYAALP